MKENELLAWSDDEQHSGGFRAADEKGLRALSGFVERLIRCDIAGELLPGRKRQRVAGSELRVAREEAEVAGSELLVASGNTSAEGASAGNDSAILWN